MTNNENTFVLGSDFDRIPRERLEPLLRYGTCVISDAMYGFQTMDRRIQPLTPGTAFVGQAITAQVPTGDNLAFHQAIEIAQAGDVIVVDSGRSEKHAMIGDMMAYGLFAKGVAGLVVDGVIRDVETLQKQSYPIFSTGHVPTAPTFLAQGRLNHPIACGDVPVLPGDIVVADADGIVVVPPAHLEEIVHRCEKKLHAESEKRKAIESGNRVAPHILERIRSYGLKGEE